MPLADLELVVLNDVQGSLHTARVCAESDLSFAKVSQNRDLWFDSVLSPQCDEVVVKLIGVARKPNPVAVHKDFGQFLTQQIRRGHLLKFLDTPILELLNDFSRVGAHRSERHQSQILDETTSLAFGCLSRTDHAPVRVVELARLCLLA